MAIYNDSFMNNATNIAELATGIGTAMGEPYLFGYFFLVSFFMVYLMLAFKDDIVDVLIQDGMITTLVAILFAIMGLVPIATILYPMVILFISILFRLFGGG